MMIDNRSRGFTLIELLVVIAIIGILSAVVLASLNTARSKGNDAAIKSNLSTILTQSAIYYDTNSNYGTNGLGGSGATGCSTANTMYVLDNNVKGALAQINATPNTTAQCNIAINGASWTVYAPLTNNTGSNTGFCIDSSGNSKPDTAPAAGAANCP